MHDLTEIIWQEVRLRDYSPKTLRAYTCVANEGRLLASAFHQSTT